MRQDPFHRRGADPAPVTHASPLWIGLAIVLAMLLYFRSTTYVFGKWIDRQTRCNFEVRR